MDEKTEHEMGEMRYYSSILELMGNTPLVRLNSVASNVEPLVLAKMEMLSLIHI